MKADNINSNTLATDSTAAGAADSVVKHYYQPKYVNGFNNSCEHDSVIASMHDSNLLTVPSGEQSENYLPSPLHDTGTMTMFLLAMFFVTMSLRKGFKYVDNFKKNLFSIKKRDNVFEDHNTVNEFITLIALIANTCIMEGILINCAITVYYPSMLHTSNIFTYIITFIAMMAAFYLLQLSAYLMLGYVFATKTNTTLLIKGFNASQALLGILLTPIVIRLLVYPTYAHTFISLFVFLYFLCRITFIIKGFRIFYTNYTSIFYFILYLCSGEIVPLLIINSGIVLIFSTI